MVAGTLCICNQVSNKRESNIMTINVKSLVQVSADIITVVHLKPGDVYVRLDADNSVDYTQMLYGVVSAVYNNGTDTVITAIEYGKQRYSSTFSAMQKVFKTEDNPRIFEADPEDFKVYLEEMRKSADRELEQKRGELQTAEEKLRTIQKLLGHSQLTKAETIKGIEPKLDDLFD